LKYHTSCQIYSNWISFHKGKEVVEICTSVTTNPSGPTNFNAIWSAIIELLPIRKSINHSLRKKHIITIKKKEEEFKIIQRVVSYRVRCLQMVQHGQTSGSLRVSVISKTQNQN
jgi:hypothetical protein